MASGKRKGSDALEKARAFLGAAARPARAALLSVTSREARRRLALKDAEISSLRKELARARGEPVPAAGTPVFFVVGNQKSGTTWLMRILDAHPEVLCRGEGRFFGATWRQKNLKNRDEKRPASTLRHALLDAEYLRLWIERSVWSRHDPAEEHLDNLTRMAVDYFLSGELLKSGKKVVGDKSPLLAPETIREISAVYPEARVIHIIRDGRDVAVSAAHHARNFGQGKKDGPPGANLLGQEHLRKLAADWAARVGAAVEDGPALLGANYAEVFYEDLLAGPETEVRRLLDFLGVEATPDVARRCVRAASFEKLSGGRVPGQEDSSSFFRKGVAGDWESVFTEGDREAFDREAGALLVRLGYASGGGR